jgi:two-component system OmpR family response regulator
MPTLLIADDDPSLLNILRLTFERAGFLVQTADHGQAALQRVQQADIDLLVLDVSMPEMDGFRVCQALRLLGSRVPVLFLSSRGDAQDRILGLEAGADDYLAKPFSPKELLLRVQALLRRSGAEDCLQYQGLRLQGFELHFAGKSQSLTATEAALLKALMKQPGRVYSREALMSQAYDLDKVVSDRTIDSHIRRVRAKLHEMHCPDYIETLHGIGYRFGAA